MQSYRPELFSSLGATVCFSWTLAVFVLITGTDLLATNAVVRSLFLMAAPLHTVLVFRALGLRPKWRFDISSYLDLAFLLSSILLGPVYCLVRNRRPQKY